MPTGGIVGGETIGVSGGGTPHVRGGHTGRISTALLHIGITCPFMHCVQVLCQRKNSRQLLVPSEKEVFGF